MGLEQRLAPKLEQRLELKQRLKIQARLLGLRLQLIGKVSGESYKPHAACPKCFCRLTPLEILAPGRLPEVVHERVRSSLLLSREVVMPDGRTVWVALRRRADGAVVTQVVASTTTPHRRQAGEAWAGTPVVRVMEPAVDPFSG